MPVDPRVHEARNHVDDASAITGGLTLALGTVNQWLAAGHLPTPEMLDSLIDRASRLRNVLERCKVEVLERSGLGTRS